METAGLKILLIEPNKKQSEFLTGILMDLGYQVLRAKNTETAIQKLLRYSPDAIICQKELKEDSGFLLFCMLRNNFSDSETPFILLLNTFNEKDLSLGFEMGIDSFIYPPYEPEKISHILEHQLKKRKSGRINTVSKFKSFFEATPFGFFICKNSNIVDTNKLFLKLVKVSEKLKDKPELSDIFDFNAIESGELNLMRCLNGISSYCSFRSVPLLSDPTSRFNIFLNVVETQGTSLRIAGLIIPDEHKHTKQFSFNKLNSSLNFNAEKADITTLFTEPKDNDFFTRRERQVLKLSAQGAPIKQIAHQMGISVRTVEKHRSNIFRKTNSGNIVEAVFYANRKHLLEQN